jgi:hypothetical protein
VEILAQYGISLFFSFAAAACGYFFARMVCELLDACRERKELPRSEKDE